MLDRSPVLLGAVICSLASAPFATSAVADGRAGPYFGLKAGGIAVQDAEAGDVEIEYDTGFAISGQVGYQFDIFRLEGAFGYQGLEGLSDNDVNSDVDVGRFTLNGYVDIPLGPQFGPYVGGGFGVANLQADDDFNDEDSGFTWHAEAGFNVHVTDQFTLGPFYRYQWIDTDLGGQDDPLEAHLFGVSMRYLLTWRGRSYDRGGYRPRDHYHGYGSGYGAYGSYRSYDRFDRYDRYRGSRYRSKSPKSPEQRERDRCGWQGPGCEGEERGGWDG